MTDPAAQKQPSYSFGAFTLDLERGGLWRGADEVKLRPKVFEALSYLVRSPNRLVAKDELMKALWPDSFVTDDSVVQCFVELRRALGEDAPSLLKTVPRRGYVFTADVTAAAPAGAAPPRAPEAPPVPGAVRARPRWPLALGLGAAGAAVALYVAWSRPPAPLADKDSILVADFANATGDAVFDGTLRQAMAVELGQSPAFDVVSEERVRETLRYMGRPLDEPVPRALAREVAQRLGVEVVLAGSIAPLGSHYLIGLDAVNAATGEPILREQVEAESRERVLGRLGEASARFRQRLGESAPSIEKFATPLEQATTRSLDAFKAYDLGRRRHFAGQYFEAIPLYRRAVQLDPEFAIAYAALALTYGTAREDDLAAEFSARAFALRARVTERERFYISNRYYVDTLGATDRAIEVMETWKQTYPRDFVPRTNLSARYASLGRHERGLAEAREGVRLNPDAGVAYSAVAQTALCLGRPAEARAALQQALDRKLQPPYARYFLYGAAFLAGDLAAMQQQVDEVAGTPTEAGMLANQAAVAAHAGHAREARELTARAVLLAKDRGLADAASLYSAGQSLWEAAYDDCRAAEATVARTLELSRARTPVAWSALALATCGAKTDALRLAGELERRFPEDFFVRTAWAPMVRAALERGGRAAQLLELPRQAELGIVTALWPAYLRGRVHLDDGDATAARAEFQKVLDHRGVLAPKEFNPVAIVLEPLAHLGQARAARATGDAEARRRSCEALLALWKSADEDLPVLVAARRECAG